ncbi:MAG TPA: class I SAM-dependent methyltransferase [bacterium]|nr:class I SAM-dependent methyltransferase [bacterium]
MNLQQKYWNSVAETKNFPTPFQIDIFSDYVGKNKKILDVGCGYGRVLNELYQAGFKELYGVDFSSGMIARGKRLYPELNLVVNEDGKLPFDNNSFDAVLLIAVLTCMAEGSDQQRLMREIIRVLKPGGILYINDYLLNSDDRNIKRYEEFSEKYGTYGVFELPEGAVVRHHTRDYLGDLLKDFEEIVFEEVMYTTMNGNTSNGCYFMGKLNRIK